MARKRMVHGYVRDPKTGKIVDYVKGPFWGGMSNRDWATIADQPDQQVLPRHTRNS